MSTLKKIVLPSLILTSLAFAFPAMAQEACRHHPSAGAHADLRDMPRHGPEDEAEFGREPRFLHGIDLSEAQRDAVFTLTYRQAPALRDQLKALHQLREELRTVSESPQFDEARARSLAGRIADRTAQLALLRSQMHHDLYALLTPEQRQQLQERHADGTFHPVREHRHPRFDQGRAM